jgi:hypothetical protein
VWIVAVQAQRCPPKAKVVCSNHAGRAIGTTSVAYKPVRGGTLPEPLYPLAVGTFGQHGTNELIYLVGLYSLVSTTLNGFNVPVPERE